jgi:hypothetical protein
MVLLLMWVWMPPLLHEVALTNRAPCKDQHPAHERAPIWVSIFWKSREIRLVVILAGTVSYGTVMFRRKKTGF